MAQSLEGPDSFGENPFGAATGLEGRGAVSRTFYGDGAYKLLSVRDNEGKAIALTLAFDTMDPSFYPSEDLSDDEDGIPASRAAKPF